MKNSNRPLYIFFLLIVISTIIFFFGPQKNATNEPKAIYYSAEIDIKEQISEDNAGKHHDGL